MESKDRTSGDPAAAGENAASHRRAGVGRIGVLALHPFLFAAAAVLRLYASNLRETYMSDIIGALVGSVVAALILFVLFGAIFRTFGAKAAVLASATLVTGLFYVGIVDGVNRYLGLALTPVSALPIVLAVLAALTLAVALLRIDLTPANAVLNGIALVLFIFPAWQVAAHQWKTGGATTVTAGEAAEQSEPLSAADSERTEAKPDIYYFIFDRYGSPSVLADYYGFDNSELGHFLEEKGFYVAPDSRSNYLKTAHSLASTFHMGYLDFLAEDPRSKLGDWHPIYDMVRNHRVGRFLKDQGYQFIQIGGWWAPTQYNAAADENYSFGFTEFDNSYLRKTIVPAVLDAVAPESTYARLLQWDNAQCLRVPKQIEKVKEIGRRSEATFVFAHILVPHDPYVFGVDGRCLPLNEAFIGTEPENYIKQVQYANSLIRDFVSSLLATDGPKPIIIIQADEGPFPARYRTGNLSWREAAADELKAKTGILNAYYFPDGDYSQLDPQVTSVNTFRIVFDKYFGTNLGRLPERIYAFPDIYEIYDFYEITDTVRRGAD